MQRFSAASFDFERIAHLIAGRPCDDCLKRHPHDFIKPEWSGQREKLPSAERQFSMTSECTTCCSADLRALPPPNAALFSCIL